MANQALTDLTVSGVINDNDVFVVNASLTSYKIEASQISAFVNANVDADNIPFTDSSTAGLSSGNVGDALRELDDNFDAFVDQPQWPGVSDSSQLPDADTYPQLVHFNNANGKPTISDGGDHKYFSRPNIEVLHTNLNVDIRSIWYDSGTSRWAVCGDDGYIATSDDDGETWDVRTSGVPVRALRTIKKWGANWYCVGWGSSSAATAIYSTDNGETWNNMTITLDDTSAAWSHLVDIAFSGTKMLFLGFRTDGTGGIVDEVTSVGSVIEHRNEFATPNYLYGAHWDSTASLFYIVGSHWSGGTPVPFVATSTDGVTHVNTRDSGLMPDGTEMWVVWGEGGTVFVGQAWNGFAIYRNDNSGAAGSWSEMAVPDELQEYYTDPWRIVEGAGDLMLCGGAWYRNGIMMLNVGRGDTWEIIYRDYDAAIGWRMIRKAGYGNGVWLAVGRQPNNIYRIRL